MKYYCEKRYIFFWPFRVFWALCFGIWDFGYWYYLSIVSMHPFFFLLNLTESIVVDLALICSFSRMRGHLNLGNMKADEVPEDTVKAVAETLKTSTCLKLSEDGEFFYFLFSRLLLFLYSILVSKIMWLMKGNRIYV